MTISGNECGCNLENDWTDEEAEAGECLEESGAAHYCSKPAGHDGPHAACAVTEHPQEVWADDE